MPCAERLRPHQRETTTCDVQPRGLARLILNNAEFIDALKRQEPSAARHLNECFVPSIWRYVYFRVNRDSHLAEDIVAEAVLQLISAASAETAIDNPVAWMRTVALRRIQDHYRAVARVQHLIEQAGRQVEEVDGQDPGAKHDKKLERQSVRKAMDGLPETYRMALEWKYVEQLSVKVIAERLDATVKGAESVLFRARNALRSKLQSEGFASDSQGSTPLSQPPSSDSSREKTSCGDNSGEAAVEDRPALLIAPRFARET